MIIKLSISNLDNYENLMKLSQFPAYCRDYLQKTFPQKRVFSNFSRSLVDSFGSLFTLAG